MSKCFKKASVRVMALKIFLAKNRPKLPNPYRLGSGKYLFIQSGVESRGQRAGGRVG